MNINDAVIVHDPEWRDAAGKVHGPGRNHGKTGIVESVTDYTCGDQRLYMIVFGEFDHYPHWTGELRKVKQAQGAGQS